MSNTVTEHRHMWQAPFTEAGVPEPDRIGDSFLVWSNWEPEGERIAGRTYHAIVRVGTDAELSLDLTWVGPNGPDRMFAPVRFTYGPTCGRALAAFLADPSDETARQIARSPRSFAH